MQQTDKLLKDYRRTTNPQIKFCEMCKEEEFFSTFEKWCDSCLIDIESK